jgi:CRP/FNR family cyclic AMP-dependent transcriptional regulator
VSDDLRVHLARCPLFADLREEEEALQHLARICSLVRVGAGETIIKEGDEGDGLYVIVEGNVRVEKLTPFKDPYTVRFLGEDAFFGELSLLDRDNRSATVVAETDSEFLVVGRDRFQAFGDAFPKAGLLVTRRVAERLSHYLRRANHDVITLFSALVQEVEGRL